MTQVKTRKYQGGSLDEVLPKIREELGDDAIVVRQREGLTGGVGGFFQKRCVEVEARPGAEPQAPPQGGGFSVTDGPQVGPDGATAAPSGSQPEVTASVAEAMLAQAGAAGFDAQLADAQQEQEAAPEAFVPPVAPEPAPAPAADTVASALSVDDILGSAAPAPAPAPVRARVVTSPQVDAIPAAAAPPAPAPVAPPAPAPAPVAAEPAPAPVAAPAPAPAPGERQARAERAIDTLADRGLARAFSEELVDAVMAYRVPLQPGARLSTIVARELAQKIPTLPLARPGVTAWVGTGGSGKTSTVAAFARAHAEHGGLPVACISLRTPDGGATLRTALQGTAVEVHVPADDAQAAELVGRLTASGFTVVVDTPAVSPRSEAEIKSLARRLRKIGVQDVHLCVAATVGLQVAQDVVAATTSLKPVALTITHGDETDRLGAAVQLAVDAQLPISYTHEAGATGRGLRAADPAELAKALIG